MLTKIYVSHSDGGGGKCDDGGGSEHLLFDPGEYTSGTQNDINGKRPNMTFKSSKIIMNRILTKSYLSSYLFCYSFQMYMVFDK